MDHPAVLLSLSLSFLLSGCGARETEEARGRAGSEQVQAAGEHQEADEDHLTARATIGPVRFNYDATDLTIAEVQVEVPPDYNTEVWAAKLIPAGRAALLGEERCQYGRSDRTETCDLDKEAGLLLALLERPLAHYQAAFMEKGLSAQFVPAQLYGHEGYTFTTQTDGSGIQYFFLPLEGRTVLVARQFGPGDDAGGDAIENVIRSVAAGMDPYDRH